MNDLNELSSGQYSASKDMSLKIQCQDQIYVIIVMHCCDRKNKCYGY